MWGSRRDSVAPAFQPTEVFRRAGLRSFSLRGAAAGGLACGSSVGRIRDSFAGTRPSAIEPFYRATEDVSSETFFRSGWPTANMPRCGAEAGSFGRRCTLRRRSGAPSRVVCRICDGVWRNRATGFSFRGDMGPSACPSPRPIRTAAGRNDGRTGPERGPAAGDSAATGGGRDAVAPVAPTSVRRLAAIVRGPSGLLSSRTLPSIRCGGSAEGSAADMPGGRGIERYGPDRSPRFRIFGTK